MIITRILSYWLKPPTFDEIVQPFFETWKGTKINCWSSTDLAKRIWLLIRRTGSEQSEQRVVGRCFFFRFVT